MRGVDLPTRFWAMVERGDGCWPWMGTTDRQGYGRVKLNGRMRKAHRIALSLTEGRDLPPPEVLCCHNCDNPVCCNPQHLRWGTNAENLAESAAKGRTAKRQNTHCPQGHAYAGDNLKVRPRDGVRICRTCAAHRSREYQRRRRNAA